MSADTQHPNGLQYWQDATDTHKAEASYYQLVRESLDRHVVPLLSPASTMLDFGCGDGEYTERLAPHCRAVTGLDVSVPLISAATEQIPRRLAEKVTFAVGDRPPVGVTFDVVLCMGVLVCVLEGSLFASLLRDLAAAVRDGGYLILRESLAWNGAIIADLDDYVAHYRTPLDYLEVLAASGLELLHDEHLATWSEEEARSNHLWVLRRAEVAA